MTISHRQSALRTINIERDAVAALSASIDESFDRACEAMLSCKGRVVVIGMGKSGHIGNKIAATLASTGTPAMFVHPGEASHGDMGMITANDVVIALSYSGTAAEIITLLPLIKRLAVPLISITGNPTSILSTAADINLNVAIEQEACPLNLAPTSSTTATLVMGDALAIALLEARGFSAEDFAFSHPGGALGRRLLLKVDDVMHSGEQIPRVAADTKLADALLEVSAKKLGMTTVLDPQGILIGLFTDGDLRRCIDNNVDIHHCDIVDVMTREPKCARPGMLAAEVLRIMDDSKISAMAVVDEELRPVGAVHLHDLLKAGVA